METLRRPFAAVIKKVFGTNNGRKLKTYSKIVDAVNSLEENMSVLTDEGLGNITYDLKEKYCNGIPLDVLLPTAFAAVREASKRKISIRHYDVQLMAGIALYNCEIIEKKTGEGKTPAGVLPAYLNAITGDGVHIITVNDYLAKRDAEWMSPVFEALNMTVGCVCGSSSDEERKRAYNADVTYGTNNEFGFDYLRDNMKWSIEDLVQRGFNYAIVDEIDSILIDEARTPLVLSGSAEDNSKLYIDIKNVISKLSEKEDFEIDEKGSAVHMTDAGFEKVEALLYNRGMMKESKSLCDVENMSLMHYVDQSLKAKSLYVRDRDYIVQGGDVMIIDEFTGRIMDGRRYSDGLHQAIEAKENVRIKKENRMLASVTFQNYFRMYKKLSGMTGTAMTEREEFSSIYGLNVVEIPTNAQVIREDNDDVVYATKKEKYDAVIDLIEECHKRSQPVLVGSISIDQSEHLSSLLKKKKLKHNVLNARYHMEEAQIVAQAGMPGAITIATNMAGRGTDIKLGGSPDILIKEISSKGFSEEKFEAKRKEIMDKYAADNRLVKEAGGLYVIGTERHESRRIDNQLRGRSGRQGDPGASVFFVSLEDDLMRLFGSDRISAVLSKLGLKDGEAIRHPWISGAIEKAQGKVELRNYEVRKFLLKFDDVINEHRRAIFDQRRYIMTSESLQENFLQASDELNAGIVQKVVDGRSCVDDWDFAYLKKEVEHIYGVVIDHNDWINDEKYRAEDLKKKVDGVVKGVLDGKIAQHGESIVLVVQRRIFLSVITRLWYSHLTTLEQVKRSVNLRTIGSKDPVYEFQKEAFTLFENLMLELRRLVVYHFAHSVVAVVAEDEPSVSKRGKGVGTRKTYGIT